MCAYKEKDHMHASSSEREPRLLPTASTALGAIAKVPADVLKHEGRRHQALACGSSLVASHKVDLNVTSRPHPPPPLDATVSCLPLPPSPLFSTESVPACARPRTHIEKRTNYVRKLRIL